MPRPSSFAMPRASCAPGSPPSAVRGRLGGFAAVGTGSVDGAAGRLGVFVVGVVFATASRFSAGGEAISAEAIPDATTVDGGEIVAVCATSTGAVDAVCAIGGATVDAGLAIRTEGGGAG